MGTPWVPPRGSTHPRSCARAVIGEGAAPLNVEKSVEQKENLERQGPLIKPIALMSAAMPTVWSFDLWTSIPHAELGEEAEQQLRTKQLQALAQ